MVTGQQAASQRREPALRVNKVRCLLAQRANQGGTAKRQALAPAWGVGFFISRKGGGCVEPDLGDLVLADPLVMEFMVLQGNQHGCPGHGKATRAAQAKETI